MKKRIFSVLMSAMMAVTTLAGCMQEKINVMINSNGSVTLNGVIKIQKEYYENQMGSEGNELFDELKQESPNATVKEYEETIKGETYKCFNISEPYSSIKKVKKELISGDTALFNSGTITKKKFVAEIGAFDSSTDEILNESMNISKSDMKAMQDIIKLTFSITFPQKIVYTNGKLSKDKKTASWNLLKLISGASICAYTNKKDIKSSSVSGLNAKNNGQATAVKWQKAYKVSGYQIKLGTNKGLSQDKKTVNINKNTSKTSIKGLKSNKQYFIKIRSYIKVGSKKYFGKWSKVKTVK